MTKTLVLKAISEAQRFINAAAAALNSESNRFTDPKNDMEACKENATARRASMDLTRALAKLRRPL